MDSPTPDSRQSPNAGDARRGFLARATALVAGGLAYAVPALTGLAALLNPLRQKSEAGEFMRLATLDTLPADGTPQAVSVVADRNDAWNRFPNEPIGAVFLRRTGAGQIEALNVVCPHAGCSVQYEAGENKLFCPCHAASFDLSGKRLDATSPSPRDLDTLDAEVRNGNEVWVRFQNFRTGTTEKVPEA
jgi:menaquinol-cytochrome c reductase iron-sulfur subunit